eukprot:1854999-Rhodomonas_salina.1
MYGKTRCEEGSSSRGSPRSCKSAGCVWLGEALGMEDASESGMDSSNYYRRGRKMSMPDALW